MSIARYLNLSGVRTTLLIMRDFGSAMKKIIVMWAALWVLPMIAGPSFSQSSIRSGSSHEYLIGVYTAFIGEHDLYNSRGQRLRQPWQIIRQDRANFHRFGIRDPGDSTDPFFASAENRAAMETMLARGSISRRAASDIVQGHVWVHVEIHGRGGVGRSVHVSVSR